MNPQDRHEHAQNRLAKDRRRGVVHRSAEVFGIEDVQLLTGVDTPWLLLVTFIDKHESVSTTSIPPNLSLEHIQLTEARSGNPAIIYAKNLLPSSTPHSVLIELGTEVEWDAIDPEMVFKVKLTSLPGMDQQFSFAEFGLNPAQRTGQLQTDQTNASHIVTTPSTYLCKDYDSFRAMMMDRLQRSASGWRERSAADLGITLVEATAHMADLLSYYQDAVGTESYLNTARQRQSLRRHARLVDKRISEGTGARTWLQFTVAEPTLIPAGTVAGTTSLAEFVPTGLVGSGLVFHTRKDFQAFPDQNLMQPYSWGAAPVLLTPGTTAMTVQGHIQSLNSGDIIILEDVGNPSGEKLRHAVRLIQAPEMDYDTAQNTPVTHLRWGHADALPFRLRIDDRPDAPHSLVARGNAVLSDQGRLLSIPPEDTQIHATGVHLNMHGTGVLCTADETYDRPATEQRFVQADRATATLQVLQNHPSGRQTLFRAVPDLLQSSPVDAHFVVEVDNKGDLILRFGDGHQGRPVPPLEQLQIAVNPGSGGAGNVGPDVLSHLHTPVPMVREVRNPVGAAGGSNAEPLETARQRIITGKNVGRACVTPQDYADLAQAQPQIKEARAVGSWSGSWPVVTVHVLPEHGDQLNKEVVAHLQRVIDAHRRIGVQVEIRPAVVVHIHIDIKAMVSDKIPIPALRRTVTSALGLARSPSLGFFTTSQWGFGRPVYDAPIVRLLSELDGVQWIERMQITRCDGASIDDSPGIIQIRPHEVIRARVDSLQLELEPVR